MDKDKRILGVSTTVFALGIVSLLTDISSEMLIPIVPQFLKFAVGATALSIGLIEGIAESVASVLRVYAGYLADKFGRPKLLTTIGYGVSALSKPFYLGAHTWPTVLGIRFADRFGKGVRSAPRDILIADTTPENERGRAFGLHRAMDTTGAMLGPLIIALLVLFLFGKKFLMAPGEEHRSVYHVIFLAATVPAVLGWLVLVLFVRERPKHSDAKVVRLGILGSPLKKILAAALIAWLIGGYFYWSANWPHSPEYAHLALKADAIYFGIAALLAAVALAVILFGRNADGHESGFASLGTPFKVFLAIVVLFSVGNSSDAFLVLRATSAPGKGGVGMPLLTFLWVYVVFNGLSAIVSLRSGLLSDKVGRKPMIVIGWLIFSIVYFAMARLHSQMDVWVWFVVYGVYYGLTEGMLRAFAVDLAPANLRGTAVGSYFTFTGIALLPASLIAGALWDKVSPSAPFYLGAATALLSALLMAALVRKPAQAR